MFDLHSYLKERAQLIERALKQSVDEPTGAAARLHEAMRYSLLAGGKRLRPVLVLASCEAVGGNVDAAMGLACAVEMIHTYSLIHDDLPCMDDDDLRRGTPDQSQGLRRSDRDARRRRAADGRIQGARALRRPERVSRALVLETVAELATAAGSRGMVAGQVIDLIGEGKSKTVEELEELHGKKTGALFLASVRGGARLGGASARANRIARRICARARAGVPGRRRSARRARHARADGQAHAKRFRAAARRPIRRYWESSARWIWRASSKRGRIARCRTSADRADPLRHIATLRRGAQAVSALEASAKIAHAAFAPGYAGRAGAPRIARLRRAASGAGRVADSDSMRAQLRHRSENLSPRASDVADCRCRSATNFPASWWKRARA